MAWRNINSGLRPVHIIEKFNLQYLDGFSEKNVWDLLRGSLASSYVPDIKRLVKVPLDPREFNMLVSPHYNIGATVSCDPTRDDRNHKKNISPLPLCAMRKLLWSLPNSRREDLSGHITEVF
jgi:hypothetical protein